MAVSMSSKYKSTLEGPDLQRRATPPISKSNSVQKFDPSPVLYANENANRTNFSQ